MSLFYLLIDQAMTKGISNKGNLVHEAVLLMCEHGHFFRKWFEKYTIRVKTEKED